MFLNQNFLSLNFLIKSYQIIIIVVSQDKWQDYHYPKFSLEKASTYGIFIVQTTVGPYETYKFAKIQFRSKIQFKIKIYELSSGFSEVKMSIKIDVSISFTDLLQIIKTFFFQYGGSFFDVQLGKRSAILKKKI